jgi:pyruvate/2-oxoglutarate dehydrogenase complex dihydrolipoamide dehydrogenase (E3) component
LPASLAVLGGGAVGCELGQLLARFGVEVTIVEAADRLLAAEEPEASAVVTAALVADGVTVHTGVAAAQVEEQDGSIVITTAGGDRVIADRLLVATGRRVDLTGLGLDTVGLDGNARSIEVDDRMRAGDGLWAIGDVTGRAMFTHVALHQGSIVVADLLGRPHSPARYDAVPRVTFTDPEVGAVGLTEALAVQAGVEVAVAVKQVPATFRGWLHRTGNSGLIKLVVDRATGNLVGATAAGPHGGEVLGMLSLAVHARVPLSDLRSMIYAFPTFHGGIGEVVGAYGRGVGTVLDPGYDGLAALDPVG